MTKLTINYPDDHLYHRYPQQTSPQATYIELDPEARVMSADWDGNAVPALVWHGRVRRYQLPSPYLTRESVVELMKEIAPMCEAVCDDYEDYWNGSNHVGELAQRGEEAEDTIRRVLEQHHVDYDDCIVVMDAGDWYEPCQDEILRRMKSGEEAKAVLDEMREEHHTDHRPLVIERVDRYLEYLDELADEEEVNA